MDIYKICAVSAFIIVVTAIGATGLYMVHYSGYKWELFI